MKRLIYATIVGLSCLLASCASYNKRLEADTDTYVSRAKTKVAKDNIFVRSLEATEKQIDKGEKKTDGLGLYCVVANESRYLVNIFIIGPVPDDIISIGPIRRSTAQALLKSGQYFYRSYYLEPPQNGKPNYKEDYLTIGKYVAISFVENNNVSNGWCFEVNGQLKWYKDIQVHGYAVYNKRGF